jgi:hypothetical protein
MRDKSGRGNHATAPSDAARPTLQSDASGLLHLSFNGSGTAMSTSSINFTGTNKVSTFAGVRKLSDAAYGQVFELSADWFSNNGAFALSAPFGAASNYGFVSRGTAAQSVSASATAPVTSVLTGIGDIAANICAIRLNGTQTTTTFNQGGGNYGNYPLFIGARNNSSLRFNGLMYGLIVRGTASSAAQITATERWMAGKTGVTI